MLDRNVDIFLGSTHARRAQDSASRTLAKGVTDEQVEAMSAWARKGVLESGLREADEARRSGKLEGPKPTDDIVRHRHSVRLTLAGAQDVPGHVRQERHDGGDELVSQPSRQFRRGEGCA